jgi:hypothetical protein
MSSKTPAGRSKRQERNAARERLAGFARSLTLTWQEQAMVAAILLSILVGAVVMHYRREYRMSHPAEASPAPREAVSPANG